MPRPPKGQEVGEGEAISRLDAMRRDGIDPDMPDQPAPWLVGWLMEVGPAQVTGMDRVPIEWSEIDAWCRRTFTAPAAWEARLLRRMSAAYVAELRQAEALDCPPPFGAEMTEDDRDLVERKLDAMFAMIG